MNDADFLELAVQQARAAIAAGQVPVGAALTHGGRLLGVAHNTVWHDCDPTGHAEINVIRQTARRHRTIFLRGCTLYSTLEPCPMCLSAILWTKAERVVFGCSITDATQLGFPELWISAAEMVARARLPLQVEQALPFRDICLNLFRDWQAVGSPRRQGPVAP